MNIISVNTGIPQSYTLNDITLETSMVRTPQASIQIEKTKVVGDVFKSPNLHGAPEAAVYAFSKDRYDYWSEFLGHKVGIGIFGENLSIDRLREEEIFLGDEFEAGSTLLKVTGPRYPCNRLNFVTGNKETREHFAEKAWPGVYFEVMREGIVKPKDKLILNRRYQNSIAVHDLFLAFRASEKKEPINKKIKDILASNFVLEKYRTKLKRFYN